MPKARDAQTGFTLIELVITLVILGILAGIAYPSYTTYMYQARRANGKTALELVSNRLEKFQNLCNSYTTAVNGVWPTQGTPPLCPVSAALITAGGPPGGAGLAITGGGIYVSPDGHYVVTIVPDNIDGTCVANGINPPIICGYTLIADPNAGGASGRQSNDGRLRLDSTGRREWDKRNNGSYQDGSGHFYKWTDR